MTRLMRISFCIILPGLCAGGCAWSQQPAIPAHPIALLVFVHDPQGIPIEGATVHLALPRYREGDKDERADAMSDRAGIAEISGIAQLDYSTSAEKLGYYRTTGPRRSIDTPKGLQQNAVGLQKISLELRPIRNPTRGITRSVDRLRIPIFGKPLGFDLEEGDWVIPNGKGVTSDLIFTVTGYFKSLSEYNQVLTLTFADPNDGIMPVKFPPRAGSAFKFPYEAPLLGYEPSRKWHCSYDGKARQTDVDLSDETHYILRVRTERDDHGNVRRALYGIIGSEVVLGGNNDLGRNLSFTYVLNPDWTRNLEFDPKKMVEAGTGKLLVQPPPE